VIDAVVSFNRRTIRALNRYGPGKIHNLNTKRTVCYCFGGFRSENRSSSGAHCTDPVSPPDPDQLVSHGPYTQSRRHGQVFRLCNSLFGYPPTSVPPSFKSHPLQVPPVAWSLDPSGHLPEISNGLPAHFFLARGRRETETRVYTIAARRHGPGIIIIIITTTT